MLKEPNRMPELAVPTVLAMLLGAGVLLGAAVVPAASAQAASAQHAGEAGAVRAQPTAATLEADSYLVQIAAAGPYKAGASGSVKVSLSAKAEFHINDQYPYRFKASPPANGVSYPKPVLERADGRFEEKTAVFDLPFVASHAGQFDVGGVLNLSVCGPTSCVVQKAPLSVTVTVQ